MDAKVLEITIFLYFSLHFTFHDSNKAPYNSRCTSIDYGPSGVTKPCPKEVSDFVTITYPKEISDFVTYHLSKCSFSLSSVGNGNMVGWKCEYECLGIDSYVSNDLLQSFVKIWKEQDEVV